MNKKTNTINILMTASDYAKKIKVSRTAVNNMIKEKRVQAVSVGGIWLVQVSIKIR